MSTARGLNVSPLASHVSDRLARLALQFAQPDPLPGLVVVPDFLSPAALQLALTAADTAELDTFCGHADPQDPGNLRNEFFKPVPDRVYCTIHQRPRKRSAAMKSLHAAFCAPPMLEQMRQLSGEPIGDSNHGSVLTAWGPWSFLREHCDFGDPQQPNLLVVSLSLTCEWSPEFGGMTGFAWNGRPPVLRVAPTLNTAVVFRPHKGSIHWVEQIAGTAPRRQRYTWTMEYR